MMRVLPLLLLVFAVGCTGIQPVGIMANRGLGGGSAPKADKAKNKNKDKDKDENEDDGPRIVSVPTPKPTPPANWVDPSEVSSDPHAAAQKLMSEFEADKKTIQTPPTTAEVSRVNGRVKGN